MTTIPPSSRSEQGPLSEGGGLALLFRRDGVLSDLSLERYMLNELDEQETSAVEEVLSESAEHMSRLNAMKRSTLKAAQIAIPDELIPRDVMSDSMGSRLAESIHALFTFARPRSLGLILALGLLAVVIPWSNLGEEKTPSQSPWAGVGELRLKGTSLTWEVYAHDGVKSRLLHNGSVVHPRNRLGFRVEARMDGYLMIIGRDQSGAVYQCAPQSTTAAISFKATPKLSPLKEAVELDTLLGREELFLIFCDGPFALDHIESWLRSSIKNTGGASSPLDLSRAPNILSGRRCKVRQMTVLKRAPSSTPSAPKSAPK